jgi:hypothetical protein
MIQFAPALGFTIYHMSSSVKQELDGKTQNLLFKSNAMTRICISRCCDLPLNYQTMWQIQIVAAVGALGCQELKY